MTKERSQNGPFDVYLDDWEKEHQKRVQEGNPGRQRRLKRVMISGWTEMLAVRQPKVPEVILNTTNGKLSEEGLWQNNVWVGAYKYYYENGQMAYEFNYNSQGKREGPQKYYHERFLSFDQ